MLPTHRLCSPRIVHIALAPPQVFSRAGAISHPNMSPRKLGILVMVGINKKNFKPSLKEVKERYTSSSFAARPRKSQAIPATAATPAPAMCMADNGLG